MRVSCISIRCLIRLKESMLIPDFERNWLEAPHSAQAEEGGTPKSANANRHHRLTKSCFNQIMKMTLHQPPQLRSLAVDESRSDTD
jgi:hypothetical protein